MVTVVAAKVVAEVDGTEAAAAPQEYPHIGTVVPSGRVVVAGPAVKLITCWPKLVVAPKKRNKLTRTAAFSVALDWESLIRIIVVASRCVPSWDIKLNSCSPLLVRHLILTGL
jgi:hypothetical protein